MANADLPPNTVVIDARSQMNRFNGKSPIVQPKKGIEDEIGPPIRIDEVPLAAGSPAIHDVPNEPRGETSQPKQGEPRPEAPTIKTRDFHFRVHSFEMRVPVSEHIVVDEVINIFAIPESSPVTIRSPRGEKVGVRVPGGKTLELVSSGITFPLGDLLLSVFFESPPENEQ